MGTSCDKSSVVSVELRDLENVGRDRHCNKPCLHVTATLTLFDTCEKTEWVENGNVCTAITHVAPPAPVLKQLLDRKFSDLTIECQGEEYTAHSIVLKCKSGVLLGHFT